MMADDCVRALPTKLDSDHIDADRTIKCASLRLVELGKTHQSPRFLRVDRELRRPVPSAAPRFHFHHNQRLSLFRNNIYLPELAAPLARDDLVPLAFQKLRGYAFTEVSLLSISLSPRERVG